MDNMRTDMAIELIKGINKAASVKTVRGITHTDVIITKEMNIAGKDVGRYITLDCNDEFDMSNIAQSIADSISSLVPRFRSALVVGLGNVDMTADALGSHCVKKILVTRCCPEEFKNAGLVSAFCPNVLGVTGIESFDIIAGVSARVKPDLIICIDSLAGRTSSRIGRSFQLTDTGIAPGSGLGLRRLKLNRESLGAEVVAIGVPMVVYAKSIVADAVGEECKEAINAVEENLVVTPKEIDIIVQRCAKAIAKGINKYLHPALREEQIEAIFD